MKLRTTSAYTFGLAVAVSLGAASAALAQADTTKPRVPVTKEQAGRATSQVRVPVQKEPAQTPAPVAETVVTKHDTVWQVAPGEVITRTDTMVQVQYVPQPRAKTRYLFGSSGFYVGAGVGTAVPYNVFQNIGYNSGFDLTIPIGWHRPGRTLGVRATLAYDQVHADPGLGVSNLPASLGSAPDPKMYSATLDAVLKFPIGRIAREGKGLSLYAIGGGGEYLFRGFGGSPQLGDALGADRVGDSKKNVHKFGIQAGAGMEYGLGPTAVFVESRWVNVFTNGSQSGNDYLRWIPIAVGITLR